MKQNNVFKNIRAGMLQTASYYHMEIGCLMNSSLAIVWGLSDKLEVLANHGFSCEMSSTIASPTYSTELSLQLKQCLGWEGIHSGILL